MTDEFWILLAAWFVPCGFLIALDYGRAWWRLRKRLRVPVSEKLLRGPGESLRKQLEKIEDQLSDELTMAFVLPLAFGGFIQALQHSPKPPFGHESLWIMAAVGVVTYGVICRRILRLVEEKRRRRLGLIGERAVGEELNHLMRQGAYVFHDVPNAPYGNVDHVVVAPSGIYAVETKTRRKREAAGTEAHRVIFDGRCLQFGGWNRSEDRCLQQARQQADRLGDWLSKAVGEPVRAQAVLALPGWYVERRGRTAVWVMSGKEVSGLVRGRAVLSESLIERIVHQLDQRCRDVEF